MSDLSEQVRALSSRDLRPSSGPGQGPEAALGSQMLAALLRIASALEKTAASTGADKSATALAQIAATADRIAQALAAQPTTTPAAGGGTPSPSGSGGGATGGSAPARPGSGGGGNGHTPISRRVGGNVYDGRPTGR